MDPIIVTAQNTAWLDTTAGSLQAVIGALVGLLVAIALVVFIWGMVVFIASSGSDEKRAAGKQRMIWGIVALFVIISVWGLVLLLQAILGIEPDDVVAPRF